MTPTPSSSTPSIHPLPDECPTPASGIRTKTIFGQAGQMMYWVGVEARRAGKELIDRSIYDPRYTHKGWDEQDDLARTLGYS